MKKLLIALTLLLSTACGNPQQTYSCSITWYCGNNACASHYGSWTVNNSYGDANDCEFYGTWFDAAYQGDYTSSCVCGYQ